MDTDSDDEPMFPYNPTNDLSSVFNYEDQLLTSPFLGAILGSDIESIKAQIQSGKDLNVPNNYGNTPLHAAAVQKSTETLNLLLQLPDINLNFKNNMGDTPLLLSLKMHQPDSFIMYLLEAGCDVNIPDNVDETPLHLAVTRSSACIALELLKRGAEINALDGNKYTPLCQAVVSDNRELVCILLYYNADVSITCFHGLTPFMYAVNDTAREKLQIAKILFDYCVDFSSVANDGYSALLLAANSMNPIALHIANAGGDVNWIAPQGTSVLLLSLHYNNSQLFKAVWPKFDHQNLLYETSQSFLLAFISLSLFPTSEWVECMILIINSPIIENLISHCTNYLKPYQTVVSFFKILILRMFKLKVKLNDRLAIIQVFLSLGMEVFIIDINHLYELYGFNEELEMFIQFGSYNKIGCNKYFVLPTFILAQEEDYSVEYLVELLETQTLQMSRSHSALETKIAEKNILKCLEFFSFPHKIKQELIDSNKFSQDTTKEIIAKFNVIPDVPSLVELSRNEVRKNIKRNCNIQIPYQFHNAVNSLHVPLLIKNIILFKVPIYE